MKNKYTALLSRLSKEDELIGESESILTQKAMLEEYTKEHGFTNFIHYIEAIVDEELYIKAKALIQSKKIVMKKLEKEICFQDY